MAFLAAIPELLGAGAAEGGAALGAGALGGEAAAAGGGAAAVGESGGALQSALGRFGITKGNMLNSVVNHIGHGGGGGSNDSAGNTAPLSGGQFDPSEFRGLGDS